MTAELPHIYGIVERWLAKAPDTEALAFGDRSWTWSELDERVRRAAGALRSAGVAPETGSPWSTRTTRPVSS